jgi:hypothetical protein
VTALLARVSSLAGDHASWSLGVPRLDNGVLALTCLAGYLL